MTTHTAPSAPPSTDPRPRFLGAARTACDLVATTPLDRMGAPTPCTEYDVRRLIGHLAAVLRRITAVAEGVPLSATSREVTDVPDDGWGEAAQRALHRLEQVWSDPAVLDRRLELPYGNLPGRVALATYTAEVTTHTWDLAVATGRTVAWDDDVVVAALAATRGILPPGDRQPGIPFAAEVAVPDDAPAIDRLVAWQGRDPRWRPAA